MNVTVAFAQIGFWEALMVTSATTVPVTLTLSVLAALVPQEFPAVTEIVPFWPVVPDVTVILVVPLPPVIVQPVGTVQVYVDAPVTPVIL